MDKMNLIEKLDDLLAEAYIKGPVSFIVMNNITSKIIIEEMIELPFSTIILSRYDDLEVLISESLANYEFRIG